MWSKIVAQQNVPLEICRAYTFTLCNSRATKLCLKSLEPDDRGRFRGSPARHQSGRCRAARPATCRRGTRAAKQRRLSLRRLLGGCTPVPENFAVVVCANHVGSHDARPGGGRRSRVGRSRDGCAQQHATRPAAKGSSHRSVSPCVRRLVHDVEARPQQDPADPRDGCSTRAAQGAAIASFSGEALLIPSKHRRRRQEGRPRTAGEDRFVTRAMRRPRRH